ncbi:MAG: MFS transporter [Verrucomicrobiales bacterium]|jgi:ACS family hexuronate transporter-like MFS transporter|nr:MFS transporter [Verrucomicrobiales bacterium]
MKSRIGNYRWTICTLVFFATTINYVDRNVIGQLKDVLLPLIQRSPETANQDYGFAINAFQIAYAIGLLAVGRLMDLLGTKRGYAAALFGWSLAAIGHAFSFGLYSFSAWRAMLGVTESGNFPAAQKAVSEWFPRKERAFATGIYNCGSNIGAILAPLIVPWLAAHYILGWSWQWAFVITGAVGLLWLIFWFGIYKSPREKLADGQLSQAEYDYIHSDADEQQAEVAADGDAGKKVSWLKLLGYRQTWSFFFGKFFTDPIWWFYLFWLPGFLSDENKRKIAEAFPNLSDETRAAALRELQSFTSLFGDTPVLDQLQIRGLIVWPVAVAVVYSISVIGSVCGGYLPKLLADRGVAIGKARKSAMLVYALLPLTVLAALWLGSVNTWLAVLVIGIGTAAHQAWSANIFTTVPDMFPKKAVGSVTGIGGMAGTLGSVIFTYVVGKLLDHYKNLGNIAEGYEVVFVVCAVAYLVAWLIMHALAPRFEKISDL